ncbi:nucleoside-diphosphate kinase [Sinorhizobium meliloti]|uniref:nucleoside-diphosphate kinase n=1 Tax=Rhizobium meliloti TaxID=382 RepID=UPI0003686A82|nr:nucleoside-diphosphate kinase [Sinorhizobium meliloti]
MSFGLLVYGPEVARSGLTTELDNFIKHQSSLEIAERFFALHCRSSIQAFYSLTGSTGGGHWPLVLDLFDLRPVCATVWRGPSALAMLQSLKGQTQPAQAKRGTIRSRFYCDNPVMNLVHVSDSCGVMDAELAILRGQHTGTDDSAWRGLDGGNVSHSFFHVLLRAVGDPSTSRERLEEGSDDAHINAREAVARLKVLSIEPRLRRIVQSYLAGNASAFQKLVSTTQHISAWDRLSLHAGLYAMPYWNARFQQD